AHNVVVKFTYNYSAEGHRLLADHRMPEGVHALGAGMYVMVMERIADTDSERMMTEENHATLREAITLLHVHNLVFGDLRELNELLVKGSGLMLVDFDWCGQEGMAKYPGDMNDD
ncbi:hypothetical protein PYCCODRAFT_1350067, partial [Trametes coccinea BRFM310]